MYRTSTGLPFSVDGLNVHFRTADSAASVRDQGGDATFTSLTVRYAF